MLIDKREMLNVSSLRILSYVNEVTLYQPRGHQADSALFLADAAATDLSASEMPLADRIAFKNCDVQSDAIVAYFRFGQVPVHERSTGRCIFLGPVSLRRTSLRHLPRAFTQVTDEVCSQLPILPTI